MTTYETKSDLIDGKDEALFVEGVDIVSKRPDEVTSDVLLMPESLRDMSPEDLEHLRKTMRWKLDLLIMPIMVSLCA
jgi:hypothetical protein